MKMPKAIMVKLRCVNEIMLMQFNGHYYLNLGVIKEKVRLKKLTCFEWHEQWPHKSQGQFFTFESLCRF